MCHSGCLLKQCVHRKPEGDASSHCADVLSSFLVHFNVCALLLVAKDVNILFDELEAVNSPCKDDDSLLHPGNLTSTSEDTSRLEAGGEVRACMTSCERNASGGILCREQTGRRFRIKSHQTAGSWEAQAGVIGLCG
jgi:hypothetical protein